MLKPNRIHADLFSTIPGTHRVILYCIQEATAGLSPARIHAKMFSTAHYIGFNGLPAYKLCYSCSRECKVLQFLI